MPQVFQKPILTTAGAALISGAQRGDNDIIITRCAIGDGAYTAEQKETSYLETLTALKSEKNTYSISSATSYTDTSTLLKILISNYDSEHEEPLVITGYYINEVGIFAKGSENGTEVLYAITVIQGDIGEYMNPYNGFSPVEILQAFVINVGNVENVEIEYSPETYALAEDLRESNNRISMLEALGLSVKNGKLCVKYQREV